ncbi:MAG: M23 family metallopeptidase [Bacteroidales bacterium]|nr:M23 family metallopeptidase [Bacteroidales bacterium]
MVKQRKSIVFNKQTLSYEEKTEPKVLAYIRRIGYGVGVTVMSASMVYALFLMFGSPKSASIRARYEETMSKVMVIAERVDRYDNELSNLAFRDEGVYRTIFGMEEIPSQVRNAGFGGVDRYAYLEDDVTGDVGPLVKKIDRLTKMAYVQTMSYDQVSVVASKTEQMNAHIPVISPMNPIKGHYRISSPFGNRNDPMSKARKFHEGIDFAMPVGTPIYSVADGKVEKVKLDFFGYGNQVVIDHGFGYKTRYAHMKRINVRVGQSLVRGQYIGDSGNSGKSTGSHLHYEVIFKGKPVNPYNFVDLEMDPKEYETLVQQVNEKKLNPNRL